MVRLSNYLELAAVERHLRHDEESSVETSPSLQSEASPEKQSRTKCAAPPKLRRKRSQTTVTATESFFSSSPASTRNSLAQGEADIWSQVGIALALHKDSSLSTLARRKDDDDSLSIGSNTSIDSDKELELMAFEIRKNLRDTELKELAAEAERAAAAGHDSFTGQASTFGDSKDEQSKAEEEEKPIKPLRMRRNHTYSEGLSTPLRMNSDRKLRRKIPVMALRHMDEVVPPFAQLHLHLRSHLYETSVETEKSLVDKPIDYSILEKSEGEAPETATQGISFIQKVKEWVVKASESMDNDEVEHVIQYEQGNDDDTEYEVGSMLAQHFTSPEVTSGEWKPSPVKLPPGLFSPNSTDFVGDYVAPSRQESIVGKKAPTPADQTLATTISTESSSSTAEDLIEKTALNVSLDSITSDEMDKPVQIMSISTPPPPLKPVPMKPIALFQDSEDEDDQSDEVFVEIVAMDESRASADFSLSNPCTPTIDHSSRERRIVDTSPSSIPNLFITPVRLKGVRDNSKKRCAIQARSSLSWGYPRTDAFLSDPGRSRIDNLEVPEAQTTPRSDSHIVMDGAFVGGASSLLKPRSDNISALIDELVIGELHLLEDTDEPPIELIPMPGLPSSTSLPLPANPFLNLVDSVHESTPLRDSPPRSSPLRDNAQMFRTPVPSPGRTEEIYSMDANNSAIEPVKLFPAEPAPFNTPILNNCECIGLNKIESRDSDSGDSIKEERGKSSSPTAHALRRVTSCPSLADTWDEHMASRSDPGGGEARKSFLNVFARLSPKSRAREPRTLHFPTGQNHEFLSNYLYCPKPPDAEEEELDSVAQPGPMCIGCEITGPCGVLPVGWTKVEPKSSAKLLTLDKGDYVVQTTWFDSAAEQFDGAIERLVGKTGSDSKWGAYFRAPALSMTTPTHGTKRRSRTSSRHDDRDPAKVRGILLTPSTSSADESVHEIKGIYGVSRDEIKALSDQDRLALWDDLVPADHCTVKPLVKHSPRGRHRHTHSASDIADAMNQATNGY